MRPLPFGSRRAAQAGFLPCLLAALLLTALAWCAPAVAPAEQSLAQQSQNPVSKLVSLPIEYSHYSGLPHGSTADVVTLKPVYPVGFGEFNLINRFLVPFLAVDAHLGGTDLGEISSPHTDLEERGFGNLQYQAFFTPANPGRFVWGVGPVLELPTNHHDLGTGKTSAGLAAVGLTMPGHWVLGALVQNLWSVAGPDGAAEVNKLTFQYFVNYNLADGWYLSLSPLVTADWEKDGDQQWSVPVGGGVGKMVHFGKLPVDFKLQAYNYVERPDDGAEWLVQFTIKFLFLK